MRHIRIILDNSIKPYLYKRNPTLYSHYRNAYMQNKLVNLVRLDEFKKLIKEFPDVLVLKGLDIALNYYNDLGVRPYEDIDILIKKSQQTKIVEFFTRNGYKRYYRTEKLNSFEYYKFATKFHIHTSLHNAVYPQPYLALFDKELPNFVITAHLDGLSYKRLETHFNFIYITLHSLKHNFDSSIRIVDIIELSKFVNWQIVYNISKRLKCYNILITTLNFLFSKVANNIVNNRMSFIKNHSGLDFILYIWLNPILIVQYLPLLCKNIKFT